MQKPLQILLQVGKLASLLKGPGQQQEFCSEQKL